MLSTLLSTIFSCFIIGVILSAPMGPVGILCVQRTLNKGRMPGLWTGVGAALSDLFYCLLTGFGMVFVTDFIEANQSILQIVGSVIIFLFGLYLLKRNPAKENSNIKDPTDQKRETHYQDMVTGFFFTFSNPLIIFLIIPLFAQFTFPGNLKWYYIIIGYICIIGGALCWWAVITYAVNAIRQHFNIRSMWKINLVIGIIIIILSIFGLTKGILDII